jgi:hypothetical protein
MLGSMPSANEEIRLGGFWGDMYEEFLRNPTGIPGPTEAINAAKLMTGMQSAPKPDMTELRAAAKDTPLPALLETVKLWYMVNEVRVRANYYALGVTRAQQFILNGGNVANLPQTLQNSAKVSQEVLKQQAENVKNLSMALENEATSMLLQAFQDEIGARGVTFRVRFHEKFAGEGRTVEIKNPSVPHVETYRLDVAQATLPEIQRTVDETIDALDTMLSGKVKLGLSGWPIVALRVAASALVKVWTKTPRAFSWLVIVITTLLGVGALCQMGLFRQRETLADVAKFIAVLGPERAGEVFKAYKFLNEGMGFNDAFRNVGNLVMGAAALVAGGFLVSSFAPTIMQSLAKNIGARIDSATRGSAGSLIPVDTRPAQQQIQGSGGGHVQELRHR